VKLAKVPRWMMRGIDIRPYVDRTLESIGSEIERRQGRGLGARRNRINRRRSSQLQQRILTSRVNPRNSGRSWTDKQGSRFRGMSPRAVKKYLLTPLKEAWESRAAG
jgi:hypothetical protein